MEDFSDESVRGSTPRPTSNRPWLGAALLVIVILVGIYYLLAYLPLRDIDHAQSLTPSEELAARNEVRKNVVGAITALFVLGTAIVAFLNVRIGQRNLAVANLNVNIANKNLAVAERNSEITEEGQITQRFVSSIELIGAQTDSGEPKIELRIGGIYALERVGIDSERDARPIVETLAAYVRRNAPYRADNERSAESGDLPTTYPREDIQVALRALSSIKSGPDRYIDLQHCDLQNAEIPLLPRALLVAHSRLTHALVLIENGDINAVGADLRFAELRATTLDRRHRMMLKGANIENLTAFGFAFQELSLATGAESASLTGSVFEGDLPAGWAVDANDRAVLPDGRLYPHELFVQRIPKRPKSPGKAVFQE